MCVCLYISVSGRQDDSSERRSNSLEIWNAILERKEATSIYEQHNRHRMPPPGGCSREGEYITRQTDLKEPLELGPTTTSDHSRRFHSFTHP